MTQFAISLGVFRVNRSCKPANPAFTMSEIVRRAPPHGKYKGVRRSCLVFAVSSVAGFGGADRDRTDDLKLAKLALSQLSYGPDHSENRDQSTCIEHIN